MTTGQLIILILVFFFTSVIGVVTGSNSLIAVPAMFQVGMDEKVAVATNMFGLVFMAFGGAIPFIRQGKVDVRTLSPLIALTIVGSAIGAAIVGLITNGAIKAIVVVAMFVIVIFTLVRRKVPDTHNKKVDLRSVDAGIHTKGKSYWIGLCLTFLLAIYGGLFSGGYVTVLTASFVGFFAMTYSESIAATKVINVFSSAIATLVFMYQGLVDYRLGIILGITMFVAAYVGAHFATKMNEIWLRRIFLSAVLLLAAKTAFDLFM
jgi:uncharacterized membrane protein YfcA